MCCLSCRLGPLGWVHCRVVEAASEVKLLCQQAPHLHSRQWLPEVVTGEEGAGSRRHLLVVVAVVAAVVAVQEVGELGVGMALTCSAIITTRSTPYSHRFPLLR